MSVISAKLMSIKPGQSNAETIKCGIFLYNCIVMSIVAKDQAGSRSDTLNGPVAVVCCFIVTLHVSEAPASLLLMMFTSILKQPFKVRFSSSLLTGRLQ